MGKRVLNAASAGLHRAGYRAGEAHATYGSGKGHVYSWVGAVDDDGGALERVWTTCAHLVAEYSAARSSRTAKRFAQADHL